MLRMKEDPEAAAPLARPATARYVRVMRASERTFTLAKRLRRGLTLPEVALWRRLRGGGLDGLRFRRQHPIGRFVLDFYCAERRLAVEIDGASHDFTARAEHDERRTEWLRTRGVRVIRFLAADVLNDERLDGVLTAIVEAAEDGRCP